MELSFERALLPGGIARDVVVEVGADGRISRVAAGAAGAGAQRGLALAGMPNLHSHAFQRAMAGSAEVAGSADGSFWGWREVMYRFVARLTPEDMTAIAAFAYLEMLEAGYTAVAEFHYVHHDRDGSRYADPATLAEAVRAGARAAGIRHLLLPTLYQRGNFDDRPLAAAQRRFGLDTEAFLALHAELRRRARGDELTGVALHSLRAVGADALAAVVAALRVADPAAPVHVHVAEQAREVADCLAAHGRRPVELLLASGHVDARWCLVHATHVTAAEIEGIARSGAVVGLCPTTEGNLGDGRFPLDELVAAGGRFGVGSDSHVSIDPREELRLAEYTVRTWRERRVLGTTPADPHAGSALYAAAQAGGAGAVGLGAAGLVVGAPADLVLIDTDRAEFAGVPEAALLDAWVFAPRPLALRAAWVGGRAQVRDGRHVAREAIAAEYRAALARLTAAAR